MTTLLHQKGVLLAKIESTYNTDPTPTQAADAILVEDPDFSVDPNVLERNFSKNTLGKLPHRIGRKLASMSFMVELKGNGVQNAGSTAAKIGRLLRACGMSETAYTSAASAIGAVNAAGDNVGAVTWGSPTGDTVTQPTRVRIVCTTGGGSGTAQVSITPDRTDTGLGAAQTGVTITNSTPIDLTNGGSGAALTPTITTALAIGDTWDVWVYPTGFVYMPVSSSFESVTLYLYFDGVLHKMTGAYGTFTLEATAGEFAKLSFTFTGQYIAPTDAAAPAAPAFEQTLPPVFENAYLSLDGFAATVNQVQMDMANEVVPRSDANASDGYNGVRLVSRAPTGGVDPEMDLVANEDFWGKMSAATQMLFRTRFGSAAGNQAWLLAPAAQYTGLSYQARDNIRVLDAGLSFPEKYGNDDVQIVMG